MNVKDKYINLTDNGTISSVIGRIDPWDNTVYAYKEVLDDFNYAKQIRVSTYTFSSFENDYLLNMLYNASDITDFRIIVTVISAE